jgi:rSAM/selenodomain-associated transferase 1
MRMTVCLMLKSPTPGTVKTRLGREMGMDEACLIYRKLAEHQIDQIPSWCSLEIHYSPANERGPMNTWLGDGVKYVAQAEGNLGERLQGAAEAVFRAGAKAVLFLGADCPDVTAEVIEHTATQLENLDVVLGPAEDGGYYLIAMKKSYPQLFDQINWSTDQVLAQTMERIAELGLRSMLLPPLADVDDLASLTKAREVHGFLR